MTLIELLMGLFVTGLTAAITPFTVNYVSGVILTIKNKYTATPKFSIGAWFAWSLLPNSGAIFPESVLVHKTLTACHFIDISNGTVNGKYAVTKFRWMISSASLVGKLPDSKVAILQRTWERKYANKKLELNPDDIEMLNYDRNST